MKVAKVIGTIWSTRKDEKLRSYKLLVVQPINLLTGAKEVAPIIAADTIGAGAVSYTHLTLPTILLV